MHGSPCHRSSSRGAGPLGSPGRSGFSSRCAGSRPGGECWEGGHLSICPFRLQLMLVTTLVASCGFSDAGPSILCGRPHARGTSRACSLPGKPGPAARALAQGFPADTGAYVPVSPCWGRCPRSGGCFCIATRSACWGELRLKVPQRVCRIGPEALKLLVRSCTARTRRTSAVVLPFARSPYSVTMATAGLPMFAFEGVGAQPPAAPAEEGAGSGVLATTADEGRVSLRDLAANTKVPFNLVELLLESLGATVDTLLEHLAFIPSEDIQTGLDKAKLDDNPLTGLQRGQLLYFWKAVVKAGSDEPPPPTSGAAPRAMSTDEGTKRKIADVLDQVDDSAYPLLPPETVAQMRQSHRLVTGGDPPDSERPSADHLSALQHRISSGSAPFADFAVFGPYGRRQAKLLKFTAQVFVNGELVTKQLRGPSNYDGWRASWRVFRSAMIMLGASSPASLDRYARGIEELTLLFPNSWGVISMADETMRSERWDMVIENSTTALPWNEIIAATAYGEGGPHAHWWYMHVVGPLTTARGSAGSVVAAVEGHRPPAQAMLTDQAHVPNSQRGVWASARGQRGRGNSKKPDKGAGKTGVCHKFQDGACTRSDCKFSHVCQGCGGPYGFSTCRACGQGSGGGSKSKKSKRGNKGGKGAGASGSAK